VKLLIAWIGKTRDPAIQSLTADYLKRLTHYAQVEALSLASEGALLKFVRAEGSRGGATLILLDSNGKQYTSEEFARFLELERSRNPHPLLFAIGPADGFSKEVRAAATQVISFGKMTIAHELARIVFLEQLYRAFTILRGHPYHLAHK
jgi:23S rRNA (pseudouridine1915-N3)-methyltransferase